MKKIIALAVLAACATAASAADNAWYAGADIGSSKFKYGGDSASKTGFGAFIGYKLNENIAFEAAARRLGSEDEVSVNALQASVLAAAPLGNGFALYGRLGVGRNSVDVSDSGFNVSVSKTKAVIGAGVSYQVDKAWGVRAEYTDLGNNLGVKINQFNVAATIAF